MKLIYLFSVLGLLYACNTTHKLNDNVIDENIEFAYKQIGNEIQAIEKSGKFMNPVTLGKDGRTYYCKYTDWRSGFFPGSIWYLYELSGDPKLLPVAQKYTQALKEAQYLTWHHDIGFIINNSYGNGYRLTGDTTYRSVILQAAKSLQTRFRPVAGIIQSWDTKFGWQAERGWDCPVIIDNMMNLELLLSMSKAYADDSLQNIACTHANTTIQHHFRDDYSTYHLVDYDPETGAVRGKQTVQGFSDDSSWSRGQAWALYSYTMMFRLTGYQNYLLQAGHIADMLLRRLPADGIPYWDFDAPALASTPRDASAAAIMASALVELSGFVPAAEGERYMAFAEKQIRTLASPEYTAPAGENGGFIPRHSTGAYPFSSEVDVPLTYADYYYLEALTRIKRRLQP